MLIYCKLMKLHEDDQMTVLCLTLTIMIQW